MDHETEITVAQFFVCHISQYFFIVTRGRVHYRYAFETVRSETRQLTGREKL
jgi:hypothetical protein